ncbi:MAG: hypothetical protein KC502_11790 [Myxococcales bacterium]|nr:hypothetical protein [Myxococcales bacterium]
MTKRQAASHKSSTSSASASTSTLGLIGTVLLSLTIAACGNTKTSTGPNAFVLSADTSTVGADTTAGDAASAETATGDAATGDAGSDAKTAPDGSADAQSDCAAGDPCSDGDPCTVDSCDGGSCSHKTAKEGAACEDGDKCTAGDACTGGKCKAGAPKKCESDTICATMMCDPAIGCASKEKPGPCDDGSACTKDDACKFGLCIGASLNCEDGNECTDDSCDITKGCTHKNAVDDTSCGTKKVCLSGKCVSAGTMYAHTSSTLYRLELKTKSFVLVGKFTFDKSGSSVTDIALDRGSSLYAVTFGDLFVCKTTNAKCTWLMKLPTSFNGLTFVHKGTIYKEEDALIGVANDGGWYHVDYKANPPKLKKLGSYGTGYTSSGDAFSVLGVGTFATVKKSGVSGDALVQVDPKTGKVLKNFGAIGASSLYGFAWWDGVFYGFASNGSVWDVDIKTGKGKKLTGFTIPKVSWWGAGVSTEAGP